MSYLTSEISSAREFYFQIGPLVTAGALPNSAYGNVGCYIAGSVMMALVVFLWIIALSCGDDTWFHAMVFGYQNLPASVVTTNNSSTPAAAAVMGDQPAAQGKPMSVNSSGRMPLGSDLHLSNAPVTSQPAAIALSSPAQSRSPAANSTQSKAAQLPQQQLQQQPKTVSAVPSLNTSSLAAAPTLPSIGGSGVMKAKSLYNYTGKSLDDFRIDFIAMMYKH